MNKVLLLLAFSISVYAAAPAPIPEEELLKEIEAHSRQQIAPGTPIKPLNLAEINSRPAALLYERFDGRPQDIFFLDYKGVKIIGRKLVSNLYLERKILGAKCSKITAPMLLGIYEREQILSRGLQLFYRPLEDGEKLALFDALKDELTSELYFPYPYLDEHNEEAIWPVEFWNLTPDFAESLDFGEVAFRQYVIQWLSRFDLEGKVLYDPACSTGKFLGEIKKHYPEAYTIGQDINQQMAEYASRHIDKVYWGDSLNSPVKEADFIFFRFLNLEVVPFEQALTLFKTIGNRCRDGGYLILFGHTPVLLSSQWFQMLGLEVEQTIAHHEGDLFQFYVLRKQKPLPPLNFKEFCFLGT